MPNEVYWLSMLQLNRNLPSYVGSSMQCGAAVYAASPKWAHALSRAAGCIFIGRREMDYH